MKERGKFITIYGANNLGKSNQARYLTTLLRCKGVDARYLKYPIYNLEPTGPRINSILREGAEPDLSPFEIQQIYSQNRRDFEPVLKSILYNGVWVVAEDYKGTGIAWGMTYGVSQNDLEEINKDLFPEDLTICLDGERFSLGIEKGHLYENSGLWGRSREVYKYLAQEKNWEVVNANQKRRDVLIDIWSVVSERFLLPK